MHASANLEEDSFCVQLRSLNPLVQSFTPRAADVLLTRNYAPGRSDLVIADPYVSSSHCLFQFLLPSEPLRAQEGVLATLKDLSRNGTFVNSKPRMQPQEVVHLRSGDTVTISKAPVNKAGQPPSLGRIAFQLLDTAPRSSAGAGGAGAGSGARQHGQGSGHYQHLHSEPLPCSLPPPSDTLPEGYEEVSAHAGGSGGGWRGLSSISSMSSGCFMVKDASGASSSIELGEGDAAAAHGGSSRPSPVAGAGCSGGSASSSSTTGLGGGGLQQSVFSSASVSSALRRTGRLWEDYGKIHKLGEGSFSCVWLIFSKVTGERFAAKQVLRTPGAGERIGSGTGRLAAGLPVDQLSEEEQMLKLCKHPNVVRFIDRYEEGQHSWFILELATGGEVFDKILAKAHFKEAPARSLFKQILRGVAYMHARGVVHR
jgi:hypothetical protein